MVTLRPDPSARRCRRTAASVAASGAFIRGFPLDDGRAIEPEHARADDRRELRREREQHRGRAAWRSTSASASGAMIWRTRSANCLRSSAGEAGRVDRVVHDQADAPRIGGQPPLQHDVAAADDRDRHDRQAGLERQVEAAALERRRRGHRGCACPRGRRTATARPSVSRAAHSRILAWSGRLRSTSMWPVRAQVPAEEREPAERLLGDDAQLKRQRPEQDRDVVDALVVADEDVGAAPAAAARGPTPLTRTPLSSAGSAATRCARTSARSGRCGRTGSTPSTACRGRSV